MSQLKLLSITPVLVFIVMLLCGLYFGIGGLARARLDDTLNELEKDKYILQKDTINVEYDGLSFSSKYELKYFLEAESIEKAFPWSIKVSSFVSLLITAFSFGLLGSLTSLIKDVAFGLTTTKEMKVWSIPLLGFLTGFVVFGLSYLLPTVLVKKSNEIRPITLMFLCFFGGMYSRNFYEKISQYFNKMFLS